MRPGSEAFPARVVEAGWLVWLRWVGMCCLLALAIAGPTVGFGPRWPVVVLVLVAGTASNALLMRRADPGDGVVTGVLLQDTVLLTLLFADSGGESNPFVLFYAFPVVLGALVVRPAQTGLLLAFATACYGSLFFLFHADLHDHGPDAMRAHLVGMFIAYVASASLLVLAVHRTRVTAAAARAAQSRAERLAALATLAAGAAHELATPLSTILVACGELGRKLSDPACQSDVQLMREEVGRCQDIVTAMSAELGSATGEGLLWIATADLVAEALDSVDVAPVSVVAGTTEVQVPVGVLAQVIRRLLGNARDASAATTPIDLTIETDEQGMRLIVSDRGAGMSQAVLDRATEPFYTTKAPGLGMGLGLFFVASVATSLGGSFTLVSRPNQGTTATLTIPCAVREPA